MNLKVVPATVIPFLGNAIPNNANPIMEEIKKIKTFLAFICEKKPYFVSLETTKNQGVKCRVFLKELKYLIDI